MRTACRLLLITMAPLLASCSDTIFKQASLGGEGAAQARLVSLDARQRAIISTSVLERGQAVRRICAEPSPDVLTTLSAAVNAQAGANFGATQAAKQANAALGASVAEAGASLNRTQTVNMLRELMYRTCERYMNGAISEDELVVQAARDQRIMLGILAIEQLTSTLAPQPVVLGSIAQTGQTGQAGTPAAPSTTGSSTQSSTGSSTGSTTASAPSSSASSTPANVAAPVPRLDAAAISALGTTVKDIALTIADTDEVLLLCVRVIAKQDATRAGEGAEQQRILAQCFDYIEAKVANAAALNKLAAEQTLQGLARARNQAAVPVIGFLFPAGVLDQARLACVVQAYTPASQRPAALNMPNLSAEDVQQLMGRLAVRASLEAAVRQCQPAGPG
jgi:hypothetical protein